MIKKIFRSVLQGEISVIKNIFRSVLRSFEESYFCTKLMNALLYIWRRIWTVDEQYILLKNICEMSRGWDWVLYSDLKVRWPECPPEEVILNLANYTYIQVSQSNIKGPNGFYIDKYFPNPEAFSYVRQCRDSLRNLVITTATLFVTVWTLLATLF